MVWMQIDKDLTTTSEEETEGDALPEVFKTSKNHHF
jgi:hypothetical protein